MSTTTTPVKRRSLPPTPATVAADSATLQNNVAESVNGSEVAEVTDEQEQELADRASPPYAPPESAAADIASFRQMIQAHKAEMDTILTTAWGVPLSRETVFAFGELNGQYALILALLRRDITDAENGLS